LLPAFTAVALGNAELFLGGRGETVLKSAAPDLRFGLGSEMRIRGGIESRLRMGIRDKVRRWMRNLIEIPVEMGIGVEINVRIKVRSIGVEELLVCLVIWNYVGRPNRRRRRGKGGYYLD
jgi:hypothetical protein